jgi:4-aminobutyrate aminotransferase-like enzyme
VTDRAARTPATEATARLVNGLREKRVLISAAGPHANILKIRPPLVFSSANAEQFLAAMDEVLGATAG